MTRYRVVYRDTTGACWLTEFVTLETEEAKCAARELRCNYPSDEEHAHIAVMNDGGEVIYDPDTDPTSALADRVTALENLLLEVAAAIDPTTWKLAYSTIYKERLA